MLRSYLHSNCFALSYKFIVNFSAAIKLRFYFRKKKLFALEEKLISHLNEDDLISEKRIMTSMFS